MSLSYGSLISFFSIINQCMTIVGYKNPADQSSTIVIAALSLGLFSTILFSYGIRKTHKFRYIISICNIFLITGLMGAAFNFLLLQLSILLKIDGKIASFMISGCSGFFLVPLTALFAAYASEAAFPESQGSVTGYLFAVSQTFGFILGFICVNWMD